MGQGAVITEPRISRSRWIGAHVTSCMAKIGGGYATKLSVTLRS
jgi:hypothetical protein